MVVFFQMRCNYCGLKYLDWEKHTDNECKRRLKLQLERLKERHSGHRTARKGKRLQ